MKILSGAGVALLLLTLILPGGARGASAYNFPSRDYLTPQEIELVKEAQILDKRIEVFIKAAERRLQVLTGIAPAPTKQDKKDAEKWGDLPAGTRAELITDISGILDAAITNIDDVAVRDEKNALVPKALRKLADAATHIQGQLTPMYEQSKDKAERLAIEQALQNVQEILEAAGKLPPPTAPVKK
ncbi:MAG TPA: hypothetical protein VEV81_04170 [Pyrinomonadaceae bacterium]|nr:hypothetical protein [Pyrinomonadaceae bacterium]